MTPEQQTSVDALNEIDIALERGLIETDLDNSAKDMLRITLKCLKHGIQYRNDIDSLNEANKLIDQLKRQYI